MALGTFEKCWTTWKITKSNRKHVQKNVAKIENKITEFFDYTEGVRQRCPLSPLLFNLYVNDISDVIDQLTNSHIQLYDNKCLNVLMYADDLILIAESEKELQLKLDT